MPGKWWRRTAATAAAVFAAAFGAAGHPAAVHARPPTAHAALHTSGFHAEGLPAAASQSRAPEHQVGAALPAGAIGSAAAVRSTHPVAVAPPSVRRPRTAAGIRGPPA